MNAVPEQKAFVVEVEQEVLGALLLGGDYRKVASFLKPHHFVEDIHVRLYETIATAHERYGSTSAPVVSRLIPTELASWFGAKTNLTMGAYLARLAAGCVYGPARLEASARGVVEQWARVTIAAEAGRLSAAASDPGADPAGLVRGASQAFDDILTNIRKNGRAKTRASLAEASAAALAAARDAVERGRGLTGITWGLSDVNRLTGGMQRRDLTLIAARPSMGKTTVGLSCAIRAAKSGAGVGFISLEMDREKLAARALSDIAYDWNVRVPYVDLLRGQVDIRDIDAIEQAGRDFDSLPLWIEDGSGMSVTDIRTKIEAMMEVAEAAGNPLGVVVVDHLGLVRASNRYAGNRANEIAEMTGAFKGIAREYDIAVVVLSQLNRAVETREVKRPQLSDIRDSGAIEQDADTIAFLYREAYYLEREKGGSAEAQAERTDRMIDCQNKLQFIIEKQRNGPLATVDLFVDMGCAAVRNGAQR